MDRILDAMDVPLVNLCIAVQVFSITEKYHLFLFKYSSQPITELYLYPSLFAFTNNPLMLKAPESSLARDRSQKVTLNELDGNGFWFVLK